MLFQARRLHADLRRTRRWLVAIGTATFLTALVTTYMAVFSLAEASGGALAGKPPHQPLAFLRVIDPHESITTRYETTDELTRSALDAPGIAVLLDRMAVDDRAFITVPLDAFVSRLGSDASVDPSVLAIVGAAPPFLDRAPRSGAALLWGTLPDQTDAQGLVTDTSVDGRPVEQVSEQPLTAELVTGGGRRVGTSGAALVAVDPATARGIGISTLGVAEIVQSFTCYCEPTDLLDLAESMTRAESEAGTGRAYYVVGHDHLVGPTERSIALTSVLTTAHGAGTLLSAWCVAVMAAQVLWSRRGPAYLVERLTGSSAAPLHARSQLLIGLGFTLPALAGVELVNLVMQSSTWPPPLTRQGHLVAVAVVASMHFLVGALTWIRLHRLCRHPSGGVCDV